MAQNRPSLNQPMRTRWGGPTGPSLSCSLALHQPSAHRKAVQPPANITFQGDIGKNSVPAVALGPWNLRPSEADEVPAARWRLQWKLKLDLVPAKGEQNEA